MSEINGGELLARTLADAGVTHAFGVHGGHLDALLVSMARRGITLVDTRHEAAAGHAAQAFATATGGLGVAFCTSGPGFTNAFTAMANAHLDRTPVIFLTSSAPLREAELNVLQSGIDQVAAARTVTRWAVQAARVARVPDLAAQAIRRAYGGVPGPVLLDVPIDVMFRPMDESLAPRPLTFRIPPSAPSRESVAAVADVLRRSERPVIVLGAGAGRSQGAREALEELGKAAGIPMVETAGGRGVLSASSPVRLGATAELAVLPRIGKAPDTILLLGARRGIQLGGRSSTVIPEAAAVVQVDVDPAELGRIGTPKVAIEADVTQFARELATAVTDDPGIDFSDWNAESRAAQGLADLMWADAEPMTESGRIHPAVAAAEIWRSLGDTGVVISDGGEASGWIAAGARARRPGDYQGIGMLGGLGIGTGFSIGLACARPGERVVAVTGDGAIGFHIQEWDTMLRHRLPVTTVIMNNLGWGMSFHGQDAIYGAGNRVVSDLPDTRYDKIAAGFGLHAERVERVEDIGPALRRAKDSGGPACIDIAIAPDIVHPMMRSLSEKLADGTIRVPYYEPIPAGEA
jgi:acetolactate synthase-1/2/3 large subunit